MAPLNRNVFSSIVENCFRVFIPKNAFSKIIIFLLPFTVVLKVFSFKVGTHSRGKNVGEYFAYPGHTGQTDGKLNRTIYRYNFQFCFLPHFLRQ